MVGVPGKVKELSKRDRNGRLILHQVAVKDVRLA